MFESPKTLKLELLGGGVEGETRPVLLWRDKVFFKGGVRGQRLPSVFWGGLKRVFQVLLAGLRRGVKRQRRRLPPILNHVLFAVGWVEGPGCLSILNFEQLISSCNLEVELKASSLLFKKIACCKLFRSKILHVLFVSALSFWRSSVQLHGCLTWCYRSRLSGICDNRPCLELECGSCAVYISRQGAHIFLWISQM